MLTCAYLFLTGHLGSKAPALLRGVAPSLPPPESSPRLRGSEVPTAWLLLQPLAHDAVQTETKVRITRFSVPNLSLSGTRSRPVSLLAVS